MRRMTDFSPKQREMIWKVRRIAGVSNPDFEQTKEWMLGLAEIAQEMEDENIRLNEDPDHLHEIADSEVPYSNYLLWLIWTDLQLYRQWPDMEYGAELIDKNRLTQIPQFACYEIALRVFTGWGEGEY